MNYDSQSSTTGSTTSESEVLVARFDVDIPELKPETGSCGFLGSLFNLMNTIVGAGVLSLPFAMKSAGIGNGTFLLAISALFAYFSIYLLVTLSDQISSPSYELIGKRAFGVVGERVVALAFLWQNCGGLTSLLCVVGDIGPALATAICSSLRLEGIVIDVICSRYFWITVATVLFIIPLSLVWNLSGLKFVSYFAIGIVLWFVITLSFRFFVPFEKPFSIFEAPRQAMAAEYFKLEISLFLAVPIFTFAFLCHTNLLHIYKELKGRSVKKILIISGIGMGLCFVVYTITGSLGYLAFQGDTDGDVLINFAPEDWLVDVVRFLYVFTIIFSYPLILYPTRRALESLFLGTNRPFNKWRFWIAGFVVVAITFVLAMSIPKVQVVFSVTGSTGGVIIIYMLPPIFYLKLTEERLSTLPPRSVLAILVLMYGLTFGTASFFVSVYNAYETLF